MKVKYTLLAEFQKPQQPLNCQRQDFIVRFEMKLKIRRQLKVWIKARENQLRDCLKYQVKFD